MHQNVERFLAPQESYYDEALKEIKSGYKSGHWIWWIFPQMRGLGFSPLSQKYGIESLYEAHAYFEHPILKKRLMEITHTLLTDAYDVNTDIEEILGPVDAMKVKSCMTLFDVVSPHDIFEDTLSSFYNGERDQRTLKMIAKDKEYFESNPFEKYGIKINPRTFFESNVAESDEMTLDRRAATLIEMYTKGENLNDLVCWYLVNKRDIFSNYRTEGIISSWGSLCRNIINDCFDEAVKNNDEPSQQKLKDCYKANKLDDIYHYTNPQDVADILMKEIDFLNYNTPFDDHIRYLINNYSLIKKPWQH